VTTMEAPQVVLAVCRSTGALWLQMEGEWVPIDGCADSNPGLQARAVAVIQQDLALSNIQWYDDLKGEPPPARKTYAAAATAGSSG